MRNNFAKFTIIVSLVLFFVRLIFISETYVVDDEAYYGMYARYLSWGYIDHGPVVALTIWLFSIFGENGLTLRLGALFYVTLMSIILYYFGRKYFHNTFGLMISLLFSSSLIFHTNSIIITPDAPLAFFSILSIILYYIAFFHNERYIYLGGVCLGIAMLSKISAIFPAIGIALFPVLAKEKRYWLKKPDLYLSFFISMAIFSPFIIWNINNDMAFFRYQGEHISRAGTLSNFIELWLGLTLLVGPPFFYFSVLRPIINIQRWKKVSLDLRYFSLVTLCPLIYFLFHSIFSRLELNWVAPVFFGGIFIFSLEINSSQKNSKAQLFQIAYSLSLIILITLQSFYSFLPLKGKSDPTNRYYMYHQLITDIENLRYENPKLKDLRIVGNNFQIPSMINIYINPKLESICLSIGYHNTLYSFLHDYNQYKGHDFILIHGKEGFPEKLKAAFESYELLEISKMYRNTAKIAGYSIWIVKNFSGVDNKRA